MSGWIKLHRKIQEHWLWQGKPFDKRSAWIDLLMMANHEDKKILIGNELVEVKRGSRITSIRHLCERWGWSNTKVKRFLNVLQDEQMLFVKSDTKKTTITIVNYEDYQNTDDTKNDAKTTQKQHKNDAKTTQKHTNKNEKNEKNDKNINNNIYSHLFAFWNLQKIIVHKKISDKIKKSIDKALKTNTAEEIKIAITRYSIMLKDESYKYCKYKWTLDEFLSREKGFRLFLDEGSKWINYKEIKEGSNGANKQATGQAVRTGEKKSKWEQFVQHS